MSWVNELIDLYEKNSDKIGIIEYRGEIPYVLLPPFHTTVTAQITVTIDEKGNFKSRDTYTNREAIVSQEELYQEWKAQIEKFIKIMGHKPTHLDSHHHVHLLNSNIDVALKLAHEYDLPIRQETYLQKDFEPVYFEELFYNQDATFEMIDTILHKDVENYELMCHPAMIDWKLYQISSYNLRRAHELDIICSQKAKEMTKKIELINYQDIKKI